jgi:hypothetical protein
LAKWPFMTRLLGLGQPAQLAPVGAAAWIMEAEMVQDNVQPPERPSHNLDYAVRLGASCTLLLWLPRFTIGLLPAMTLAAGDRERPVLPPS